MIKCPRERIFLIIETANVCLWKIERETLREMQHWDMQMLAV